MGHCIWSVCPAALLHASGQHGPAHNGANPSYRGTHSRCVYQHTTPSPIPDPESGTRFGLFKLPLDVTLFIHPNAYINPFHFVISQDIPDESLTLGFWLKILMHLLGPAICSALGNLQCFFCFSGEGYNSSELGSYSFIVSQILRNTKGLSKHFTSYCICWTGYSTD